MNVILYLKLEKFDDGDFDVSNDYYKSDEEFFDAMNAENKRNSNLAYDVVSNLGNNVKKNTAHFNNYTNTSKKVKENNYKSEAQLINEKGKDETVNGLISNCFTNDVAVYLIKFNRESMDEEFEEDYNFWISEHENINQDKYKKAIGEDKIWQNEPARTFYVEFINKANETKYAKFENCKIIENDINNDECAILVEKITLENLL